MDKIEERQLHEYLEEKHGNYEVDIEEQALNIIENYDAYKDYQSADEVMEDIIQPSHDDDLITDVIICYGYSQAISDVMRFLARQKELRKEKKSR
ncbi:hypothetical protein CMI37_39050 [Candidatus Pacearchaeota archaeon]|nr:hypothetical protein [Candidatus Pacearchaeota archaeon]